MQIPCVYIPGPAPAVSVANIVHRMEPQANDDGCPPSTPLPPPQSFSPPLKRNDID